MKSSRAREPHLMPPGSASFAEKATKNPALTPQEVPATSRIAPRIPANLASESPAHGSNPRLSPLRPEVS